MRCSPGGDSEKWLDEVIAQGLQSESAYEQARAVSLRGLLDAEEDAEWLTEPTRDDDSWYRSVLRIAQRRVKSERDARYWFKKFCEGTRFTANGTARMEQRMPAHERGLGLCKPHHEQTLFPDRDPEAASEASGDQTRSGANRLAYVPPHVPFVAGRDRSTDEGSAGVDASCLNPDDDECLWTGNAGIEAGSEWKSRGNGAQADESERLNH
jgi:hypothetical protein